MGRLHTARGL